MTVPDLVDALVRVKTAVKALQAALDMCNADTDELLVADILFALDTARAAETELRTKVSRAKPKPEQ